MTEIPHLIETDRAVSPNYTGRVFSDSDITENRHRSFIGGKWDEDGRKQEKFLVAHGLRPGHMLLDVGCGPFRAGRHLIDFLDPGKYYGIDANLSILQTGWDRELTDEQRAKTPIANIRANDRFNVDFGVTFDFAIAQSVFTHVSLNHVRLCLYRLAKVMKPGGVFYASFCEQPLSTPIDHIYKRVPGGRDYLNEQNVFWYHRRDLKWAGSFSPWQFDYVGGYNSTQDQMMVSYTRLPDGALAPADRNRLNSRRATAGSPRAQQARKLMLRGRRRIARAISPD